MGSSSWITTREAKKCHNGMAWKSLQEGNIILILGSNSAENTEVWGFVMDVGILYTIF